MGVLSRALADPLRKQQVILDATDVVETEVASKSGFRGAALKAGFRAFKSLRPGIVPTALERLLPHFTPALDPLWDQAAASGDADAWFRANDARVAGDLLAVTDRLAGAAQNKVMLRIYRSLRGSAEEHVRLGVPRIPELIRRHLS